MKFVKSSYNGKASELRIMCGNDWHVGHPASDLLMIDKFVNEALENEENTRILLNGDYIENAIIESKGDIYDQTMSPNEQLNYVIEKLKPIAHLVDGVTEGNHDFRTKKATSIDVVQRLVRELDIDESKYLGAHGAVGFAWNTMFYSIEMHHGVGGGSTLAAVENAMKKLWKSDSDVMYCGHWHKEFIKPIKRFRIDTYKKTVKEEKRWLVCGNTTLNTAEYAKRGGFEESYPSQAIITLSGEKYNKNVDISWMR